MDIINIILTIVGIILIPLFLALIHFWTENKKNKEKIKEKSQEMELLRKQVDQKDQEIGLQKKHVEALENSLSEMNLSIKQKNAIANRYTNYVIDKDREARNKGLIDYGWERLKRKTVEGIADNISENILDSIFEEED